jgi:electron transport complex protein RnfG
MATERVAATAARVSAVAGAAALLLWLGAVATRERAVANDARRLDDELAQMLPGVAFDNRPAIDRVMVRSPALLGSDGPLPAYRARRGGAPVAVVLTVVARQGYAGPLRLRVSIGDDGRVILARVIGHAETPGVGDRVEREKSAWMDAFAGRSLLDPDTARWRVRRDGGEFDQLTGATVTSRAVVNAVRDALVFFGQERAALLGAPAE